jgi:superfamily I DNA/RNA helicase
MRGIEFATNNVVVYLAAAGAGKTSALTDEMTELLKIYRPDEIAFVTFTRKGVANGIERALQANPQLIADDLIHFRTLHALCFRELGLTHASIITQAKIQEFNKAFGFNITLQEAFEHQSEDDKLLFRYDAKRSGSRKLDIICGAYDEIHFNKLVKAYEGFKHRDGLVDFYDCLLRFCERNMPVGVKVAFIDEAQDLTPLQWEVCRIAFSACEKIRIAGDDYQSLFTYAGASPAMFISLAEKYRAVKLEISYRLPKSVYRFAKGITRMIAGKIDKDYKPAKDFEGFVEEIGDRNILVHRILDDMPDKDTLARWQQTCRWYLLFRNNCFIEETAALLEQYVVPYHTAENFCVPREELVKIRRYHNYRKQGFGDNDGFEKFCKEYNIKNIAEDFTESMLIASRKRYVYRDYVEKFGVENLVEMANREPYLLLSTIHKVKGGEADFVAVFLDCTERVANNARSYIDEELRTLYVACTRARIGLFLAASRGRNGLDRIIDVIKEQVA